VKRCWELSPERRPEISELRRDIDEFYRGSCSGGQQEGYYSQHEVAKGGMYNL